MSQAGSTNNSGGGGGSGITQLSGDTGVAKPVSGNINVTALNNGTTNFQGSSDNLTLNFFNSNENIVLTGSPIAGYINGYGNFIFNYFANEALCNYSQIIGNSDASGQFSSGNDQNSYYGNGVANYIATQTQNVAIGNDALNNNSGIGTGVTKSFNVALGWGALSNAGGTPTSSYNVAVGWNAGATSNGVGSSNIYIQNAGNDNENNTIRIGTTGSGDAQQDSCYIAGIAGNTVSNAATVTIDTVTGQLGSASSVTQGIVTIDGNSGSATGTTVTIESATGSGVSQGTGAFVASGSTVTFNYQSQSTTAPLAIGWGTLAANSTGSNLTAFGYNTLHSATSGNSNTCFGALSLSALLTGANNNCFGRSSGLNYTGSESSNACFASGGITGESNALHLGNQYSGGTGQNTCYVAGITQVDVGTVISNNSNPAQGLCYIDSVTGQLSTSSTNGQILYTQPPSSNTATTSFGTSLTVGTSKQNTLGYDILVNIAVTVSSATTATITLGVGSTSSPTINTVIPSFTVAASTIYTFSAIVPQNYYVLVNDTGTITISSITCMVCPI